jgi:hypothetical protein
MIGKANHMNKYLIAIAPFVGSLMALLSPLCALLILSCRNDKDSDLKKIRENLDALEAYRQSGNGTLSSDVADGARLEIYSHYLGLAAQLLAGITIAFVLSRYSVYFFLALPIYTAVGAFAIGMKVENLTPWAEYTSKYGDIKWYHGKYGLPPMRAWLNRFRVSLLMLGLVLSFIRIFVLPPGTPDRSENTTTHVSAAQPMTKGLNP